MRALNSLLRDNIRLLTPYSSARSEFAGVASVYLDANESAYGSPVATAYNRYPDPLQRASKQKLAALRGVSPEQIFLGNGSDEAIDLLMRAFCDPGKDRIVISPPTFGMYSTAAHVQGVEVISVPLVEGFELDLSGMLEYSALPTKLMFVCSPNNPSGNLVQSDKIEELCRGIDGLVVLDEAYTDFCSDKSFVSRLEEFPNLVILQTFSKAWGLAGLRAGVAYASPEIISVLNRIKFPYNMSQAIQETLEKALDNTNYVESVVSKTLVERTRIADALSKFSFVSEVFPSDANFLLIRVADADRLYNDLLKRGIVVRNRTTQPLCQNCVRITIGTESENEMLLSALQELEADYG